jgi:hypothetical protein
MGGSAHVSHAFFAACIRSALTERSHIRLVPTATFSLIDTSRIGIGMLMGHGQIRDATFMALK